MNMPPPSNIALVGEVVDRIDGRRGVQRLHPLDGVDVDRHQRRLPVVAVDDVGEEAERLAQLQRSARQEREAFEVVGVALGRRTVEVGPVEVAVVLEAVERDVAARELADAHARARAAPPHRHGQEPVEHLEVVPRHARVERHHHAHVDAAARAAPWAARPRRPPGRPSSRTARTRRRRTEPLAATLARGAVGAKPRAQLAYMR